MATPPSTEAGTAATAAATTAVSCRALAVEIIQASTICVCVVSKPASSQVVNTENINEIVLSSLVNQQIILLSYIHTYIRV